jgi:hypothetical protein
MSLHAYVRFKGYNTGYHWIYTDGDDMQQDDNDDIGYFTLSEKILIPLFFGLILTAIIWLYIAFYHDTFAKYCPRLCSMTERETMYVQQAAAASAQPNGQAIVSRYSSAQLSFSAHPTTQNSQMTSNDRHLVLLQQQQDGARGTGRVSREMLQAQSLFAEQGEELEENRALLC